jgi:hypothetical protein
MKKYNFTGNEAIFDYKQLTRSPYKPVFGSVYPVLVAIMLGISCMKAQVIIGGNENDEPSKGSVLSLNSTMRGGLQLSNVELGDLTGIPDSFPGITSGNKDNSTTKDEFKGAIVHKANSPIGQGEGFYTWNRRNWDYLGNNTRYFVVPDYANGTDVINDTGTGTWTADKSGFVICTWVSPEGSDDTGVWIGNEPDKVRVIGYGYTNTDSGQKAMIPIAVGQVLTVNSSGAVSAVFYPPLFAQKNVSNGSYSFTENKTNDVWLDGKPIYKKTVYSENTNVVNGNNILMLSVFSNSVADIDKVLKLEGYGYLPNDSNKQFTFIGSWASYYPLWILNSYYDNATDRLILERTGGNITINDLTITLYYTKTTDQ